MSPWVETILEIVKVTVPALIVFLTVYHLMKQFMQKEVALKNLEIRQNHQSSTIPMRLQAYERLSLFLERIGIPGMMLRVQEEGMSASQMRLALMVAIQREFEHNITQQVYVSDQLWSIISLAREDVMRTITTVYEQTNPNDSAQEFGKKLVKFISERGNNPLETAQSAIKKEAGLIL